jgi:hypothetical protein
MQIDGELPFGSNNYLSPAHEKLMKAVLPLRKGFPGEKIIKKRIEIASQEYDLWRRYLEEVVKQVPSVMDS